MKIRIFSFHSLYVAYKTAGIVALKTKLSCLLPRRTRRFSAAYHPCPCRTDRVVKRLP